MTAPRKEKKREARREEKAEKAAVLEKSIENELLERLKKGVYGDIYNYPIDKYNEILDKEIGREVNETEEEPEIEYVEGYEELEEEDDMEDFGLALKETAIDEDSDGMDDDIEEIMAAKHGRGRQDSTQNLDKEKAGAQLKKKARVLVEVEHEDTRERETAVL